MIELFKEPGQSLIEYALIMVFVAEVVVIILVFVAPSLGNIFSGIIAGI